MSPRRSALRREVVPDKFDGTGPLDEFLEQFSACAEYNGWASEDRLIQLKLCLRGSATGLLRECREEDTFDTLVEKLRKRFSASGREVSYRAQLNARRRQQGEDLQSLYISVSDLLHLALPGGNSVHRDVFGTEAFINALDDPSLKCRVRDRGPANIDEAFRIAVAMEANKRASERYQPPIADRDCREWFEARTAGAQQGEAPQGDPTENRTDSIQLSQIQAAVEKLSIEMAEMRLNQQKAAVESSKNAVEKPS